MSEAVSIVRWDRYQRAAKKVRDDQFVVTNTILNDKKIRALEQRHAWQFVVLMALASKHGNILPRNESELEELAGQRVELQPLVDAGLLKILDTAELERREKARAQEAEKRAAFAERCRTYWNNLGISPQWTRTSAELESAIWARRADHGEDGVKDLIRLRCTCEFFIHRFKANPSWVFRKKNAEKILSGEYRGFQIEFPRDAWDAQKCAEARGLNGDKLTKLQLESILSSDLEHVTFTAARHGVVLTNRTHSEKIRWFIDKFGKHPGQRKEKE